MRPHLRKRGSGPHAVTSWFQRSAGVDAKCDEHFHTIQLILPCSCLRLCSAEESWSHAGCPRCHIPKHGHTSLSQPLHCRIRPDRQ
jgi:hypothetical protein